MTSAHRTWLASLLTLLALLLTAPAPAASPVEQKGVGDVEYGRKLKSEDRNEALQAALRNAVETWVAEKQQSQYRNYEKVKDTIDANIDDYVLSHTVISADEDKGSKRYRVVVRARLNEPKLLGAMLGPSGAAEAPLWHSLLSTKRRGRDGRTISRTGWPRLHFGDCECRSAHPQGAPRRVESL